MRSRTIYSSIQAFLALVGTIDAGADYMSHQYNLNLPCTTGDGCDLVNASHWSHIDGIPIALIGTICYAVFLFASTLKITTDSIRLYKALFSLMLVASFFGTIYSWYLQYVAKYFIGAFCIYCRTSAVVMTCIFITIILELVAFTRGQSKKSESIDNLNF